MVWKFKKGIKTVQPRIIIRILLYSKVSHMHDLIIDFIQVKESPFMGKLWDSVYIVCNLHMSNKKDMDV